MKFHFLLSLTGTITASLTVSTLQQNGGIQSLSDVIETTRVGVVNESTPSILWRHAVVAL